MTVSNAKDNALRPSNATSKSTPKRNAYIYSPKTTSRMFRVALLMAAQTWKLTKCPSTV